ncbi:MAG: hypothetical protein ABL887_01970 [Nitrosomonas sp.]
MPCLRNFIGSVHLAKGGLIWCEVDYCHFCGFPYLILDLCLLRRLVLINTSTPPDSIAVWIQKMLYYGLRYFS